MKQITANDVATKLENGETLNIIDVRETSEVAQGKISGSVNIPLGLIEFRLNELDKNKEYIVVCLSGGRSSMATSILESQGFNVTNMIGGMMAWQGPVE